MRKISCIVLMALGVLGFTPHALAYSIEGNVICEGDGSPLEGLTVSASLGGSVASASTDSDGDYTIRGGPLNNGVWALSVGTPFPVSGPATVELTNENGFPRDVDFIVDDPICRPEPPTVSIGDRVWEDLDADGVQDCEDGGAGGPVDGIIGNAGDAGPECDTGVPGVSVVILTGPDCTTPAGPGTMTDADGFYLFENLSPGDYCVSFDPTTAPDDLCSAEVDGMPVNLGAPAFTGQDLGSDDADSDADPLSGATASVSVPSGANLSLDAGLVCPAKLGDFVFIDDNVDGMQQPGEPGVPDVEVELVLCGPDGMAGTPDDVMTGQTRTTDAVGRYMFGGEPGIFDLAPDEYYVVFNETTYPPGFMPTTPGQGDDAVDSDCGPGGMSACVDLSGSRSVNLNRDCGLVPPPPPECELAVDLTCRVEPPAPPSGLFQCDKPIDQLTMIWDGASDITVNAWKGDIGSELLASMVAVAPGAELTVSGYAGSPNDVVWEIFDAASGDKLGESTFHLSCSDDDMDGPEDCGLPQGNGKSNSSDLLNEWLLEGMVDSQGVFDCTADPVEPVFPSAQSCQAVLPRPVDCELTGKPTALTFEYTGAGCAASDNDQDSDKAECSTTDGGVAGEVTVLYAGGDKDFEDDVYTVSPTLLSPGDRFEVSRGGDDLKSNSFIQISDGVGTELNEFHTSCSQPLAVGDVFGSLTLLGINGQSGGAEVTYGYSVENIGDPISGVMLTDDPFGDIAGPFDLAAGETRQFTRTAILRGSASNTAIVTSSIDSCGAMDGITVELLPPPLSCDDGKPTRLVFEYVGDACAATTNDQEGKFECEESSSGLGVLDSVVMTKDESKVSVEVDGNTVTIFGTDDIGEKLKSEIEYEITDADGNTQAHALHTSCSKALNVGDQFGALILVEFVPED